MKDSPWIIGTVSGGTFDVFNPKPDDVNIYDIASALAKAPRFGGHTDFFYPVASHSVAVSLRVPMEDAMWGLLHDAAEAYLVDLPSPIKSHPDMRVFRDLEERVLWAVAVAFDLPHEIPASVHRADVVEMVTEAKHLFSAGVPNNWHLRQGVSPRHRSPCEFIRDVSPDDAEFAFVERYKYLKEGQS